VTAIVPNQNRFEGKVSLVTGASSGIGLAVAERLSSEGAELFLTAHPRDAERLQEVVTGLQRQGRRVESLVVEQADPTAGRAVVGAATAAYGRLDVAIANAGFSFFEDVLKAPHEHWRAMIDVNLTGTYRIVREAAALMVERGSGSIVVTASTAAWMGEELQVDYNVSKAGLVGLARSLGVALARHGVRVNAVAPGWVETPLSANLRTTPYWERSRLLIPMRRAGQPSEIAAAFAFLASDDASFITGHTLVVDGGQTAGYSFPWEDVGDPL
jgi:NAD(P)-dependent dehydrogenase (short-subunit alcohol dehydrogenase family)